MDVVQFSMVDTHNTVGASIYNCILVGVQSIIFGDNISSFNIGNDANNNMWPDLKSVTIPEGIQELGESAFGSCASLTEMDLRDTTITTLSGATFVNCTNLTLYLPNTVTSIYMHSLIEVPVVIFPNGINEALEIPDDLWGAKKVITPDAEYLPKT